MTTTAHTSPSPSRSVARSLVELLKHRASQSEIAAHIDGLGPAARLEQLREVRGPWVGRLYDAVGGAEPLTPSDLVPEGEKGTVIFEGTNSLPMFSFFQKRFAREGDTVYGYNHQTWSFVTGPGYFLVRPPTPGEAHPDELFFDYTAETPAGLAGWPARRGNDVGLSRAVYMNMKDFCRRVGKGTLVGKAYKLGVAQNAYFTLTLPY